MSAAKKPRVAESDARWISVLIKDLDTVAALLERLKVTECDHVRFGMGVAEREGVDVDRRLGHLNLSQPALKSMLDYGKRDIRNALRQLGVKL